MTWPASGMIAGATTFAAGACATHGATASTSKNTAPLSRTACNTSDSVSTLTESLWTIEQAVRTIEQASSAIRIPGQNRRQPRYSSWGGIDRHFATPAGHAHGSCTHNRQSIQILEVQVMLNTIVCDPVSAAALGKPHTLGDLGPLKTRQQATWASGDFAVIGTTLQIVGETLCEALDLRAGQRVLDVAAGNGNAALAAARRWCHVTATDYVPNLLDRAQERAFAERLPMEFEVA